MTNPSGFFQMVGSEPFVKSPIRYPGGKSKYIDYIQEAMPKYPIRDFREPFCGGASISIYFSQMYPNCNFWMNDINRKLFLFWKNIKDNPEDVQKIIIKEMGNKVDLNDKDQGNKIFLRGRNLLESPIGVEVAAGYFICNRISFAGLTEIGTFSPEAWRKKYLTVDKVDRLSAVSKVLKRVKITNYDYTKVLEKGGRDSLFILDPPYDIHFNLYGKNGKHHKGFSHMELRDNIERVESKWMMTYNSSPEIMELYKGFNIKKKDYSYCMQYTGDKRKIKEEVIIKNYE